MSGFLAGVTLIAVAVALGVVGGTYFGTADHTPASLIGASLVLAVCLLTGAVCVYAATVFLVP